MQRYNESGYSRQRKPKRKRPPQNNNKEMRNQVKMRKMRQEMRKEYMTLYGSEAPIHFAIAMNDINKLKQLLRTMCPNAYHAQTGETPLHLACRLGKLDLVKRLRRHPKINADLPTLAGPKSDSIVGSTAADIACKCNRIDIARYLTKLDRDKKDVESICSPLSDNLRVLSELVLKVSLKRESLATLVGNRDGALRSQLKGIELRTLAVEEDCKDLRAKFKNDRVDCFGVKLLNQRQADEVKLETALSKAKDIERDLAACEQQITLPKKESELKSLQLSWF